MSKWDNLPLEILELIVDCLENVSRYLPSSKTQYMLVKKQWLELFLCRHYNDVWLDLIPNDETIQKILHPSSCFKAGPIVKNIYFEYLKATDNFPHIDISQDLLYLLKEHCPNVKDIRLLATMEEENDWKYWTTFLSNNTSWRLHSIKNDYYYHSLFMENFKSYYYQCLYTSKNILQQFTLVKDMINENDYACLKEFKEGTHLRIPGNNWIDHVNECLVLLQHLPKLLELEITYVIGGGHSGGGLPKEDEYYAVRYDQENNTFTHTTN